MYAVTQECSSVHSRSKLMLILLALQSLTNTKFPNVTGRTPNFTQYIAPINFPSQPGYWTNYTTRSNWAAVVSHSVWPCKSVCEADT